jgi:hypothetical protein
LRDRLAGSDISSDLPRGHLSEQEVAAILSVAQVAGAILIGGQSVNILARRYRPRVADLRRLGAITSADVDFLGGPVQAEIVASQLANANLYLPRPFDDATPNSAQVAALIGTQRVIIDFMGQIVWVDEHVLKKRFLTLSGKGPDGSTDIKILCLHPIDCLMNRLGNINKLNRTDALAIMSAKASMMVIDGFIDEMIELGERKEAQNSSVNSSS